MSTRPFLRTVMIWVGRASGLGAVMFGLLVGSNLVVAMFSSTNDVQLLEGAFVGGSALLTVGGGASYLLGLDRLRGTRGRSMRIAGWMLYAAGLLLPTSLAYFQLAAILGGGPAAFARVEPDPTHDQ